MPSKKNNTLKPIKADVDTLSDTVMKKTTEEAIENFVHITQKEMKNDGYQPEELHKTIPEGEYRLVPFMRKGIRSVFHKNSWWFSIIDVINAVVENNNRPSKYWTDLRKNIEKQGFSEFSDKIGKLKMRSDKDGKMYPTDCVDTETLFRLIQTIPSPKVEPFRRWLAKVGYERILEKQDPEIIIKRALQTYKAKGYSDEWVNARIQTIASRKEVTNEWKKRGIEKSIEYALLTDAISQETFDLKIKQYKEHKGLAPHHNLRDYMTPLELALVMLGETTTIELARAQDARGFIENESAARLGGKIAGGARKNIEAKIKKAVATKQNFLKGGNLALEDNGDQ